MRRLTGKVVIVTGASHGLGEATARAFHAAGATVVLAARRAEPIQALATELGTALAVAGDVTEEADRVRLVEATVAVYERIDVLVNNAGITWAGAPGSEPADVSAGLSTPTCWRMSRENRAGWSRHVDGVGGRVGGDARVTGPRVLSG